jgi:hypothetical protein
MSMKPLYTLERWPHGWLLCGDGGVPLNAMTEISGLFPPDALCSTAIAHHFNASARLDINRVVLCVGTPNALELWQAEIRQQIAGLPPQERWWRGLDVGLSSAAIFAALASSSDHFAARRYARGAVPRDSEDFGRCQRLVAGMGWRDRLTQVAEAYPETKWPAIIARWDEIEAAAPGHRRTEILQSL